jgi:hypothetical protein
MRVRTIVIALCWLPAAAFAQTAIDREIDVTLRDGLALVHETLALRGQAGAEAELEELLPEGAGLASLRVCRGRVCRSGVVDRDGRRFAAETGPSARVMQNGTALWIRARPLDPRVPLRVEVRYVASTTFDDAGRVLLDLPPYAGGATVTLRAPGHGDLAIGEVRSSRAQITRRTTLSASMRPGSVVSSAVATRCGDARCLRYRAAAGPRARSPRDVFLFLDVSPSVAGIDPAHRARVLRALLDALPPRSSVTRVAFGWNARRIDRTPLDPSHVDAAMPLPDDLGPATRIARAWELVRGDALAARDPLVIVLGDSTHGRWPEECRALDAMIGAGVEVAAIDLLGRDPERALDDTVLRSRGLALDVLDADLSRVRLVAQPWVASEVRVGDRQLGGLRATQEILIETRAGARPAALFADREVRRPRALAGAWGTGLAVRAARVEGRLDARSALSAVSRSGAAMRAREGVRLPIVLPFVPQPPTGALNAGVLRRLRTMLRPRVRACFRDARRGDGRGDIHATLELVVIGAEITFAGGQSSDQALAACLAETPSVLSGLPFVDGARDVMRVRFSFRSDAHVPEPGAPLSRDVEATLDALAAPSVSPLDLTHLAPR